MGILDQGNGGWSDPTRPGNAYNPNNKGGIDWGNFNNGPSTPKGGTGINWGALGNGKTLNQTLNPVAPINGAALADEITTTWRNGLWGTAANIANQYTASNAPVLASIDDLVATARNNNAARMAQFGNMEATYRAQLANDQAGVGIDQDINSIQQQYLNVYREVLRQQQGAAEGRYMTTKGYVEDLNSFAAGTRRQDLESLGIARKEADANKTISDRELKIQRAVSGGSGGGFLFDRDQIADKWGREQAKIGVEDQRSLQGMQEAQRRNHNALENANWDLRDKTISINESKAKLSEREAILKKEAEKLGISKRALELAMQEKLNQLGLQRVMSVGQMAEAISSANVKKAETVRDVTNAATQNPMFQNALQGWAALQ